VDFTGVDFTAEAAGAEAVGVVLRSARWV